MPGQLDSPLCERDHVEGLADAPLTLVMYGDFQCPYCAAAHMHDHLYAAHGRLSTSDLVQHARDLGLDGGSFDAGSLIEALEAGTAGAAPR